VQRRYEDNSVEATVLRTVLVVNWSGNRLQAVLSARR
jgi:hypothetical protein